MFLALSGCGSGGPRPGTAEVPPGYEAKNTADVKKYKDIRKDEAQYKEFMKDFIKNTPAGSKAAASEPEK